MNQFLTSIFLILTINCFGQKVFQTSIYETGIIITKSNDTIKCLVPIRTFYEEKISIKKENSEAEQTIDTSEVKFLFTQYNVYENINYTDKNKNFEKLMRLVIKGPISLYSEIILNFGFQNGDGYSYADYPKKTYVVKKNNKTYLIPKKKFSEHIIKVVRDKPEIASRIGKKKYKFDNLESIIEGYNKK